MTKQSFIRGTMILLAAGLVNRILGFVPRIALPRIIGAEGVGLYQLGYPLLIVLLTVITGGIPLAVAKLVAAAETEGDERKVQKVLRIALGLAVLLAALFTAGLLLLARPIAAGMLNDERVHPTLIAMSPMLLVVGVSAVLRGYFQGKQNMIPTALSQTAETAVRIAAVLLLARLLLPRGVAAAAAGAMAGVTAGECCGLLVVLAIYWRSRALRKTPSAAAAPEPSGAAAGGPSPERGAPPGGRRRRPGGASPRERLRKAAARVDKFRGVVGSLATED